MSQTPAVLWAQRKDKILVAIQLKNIHDEKVTVSGTKLEFQGQSGGQQYAVTVDFYQPIIPAESKSRKSGREYIFELQKQRSGPYWPFLLSSEQKPSWLKIDFNRWKDEDDDEDDGGMYDDANLEDMMQQMGDEYFEDDEDEMPQL